MYVVKAHSNNKLYCYASSSLTIMCQGMIILSETQGIGGLLLPFLLMTTLLPPSSSSFISNTSSPRSPIFSFTTSPPLIINGVEVSRESKYDTNLLPYDRNHIQKMSLNFALADTQCPINQWYCAGTCIHRRKRCSLRGGCHPMYPMSCERRDACYRAEDDCWHRACQGEECQWGGESGDAIGMKQRRYLASCPEEKDRLQPCNTEGNPLLPRGVRQQFLCFYSDETYCPVDKTCAHVSSKCFKNRYDPYRAIHHNSQQQSHNSQPYPNHNNNEHINNLLHNQLGQHNGPPPDNRRLLPYPYNNNPNSNPPRGGGGSPPSNNYYPVFPNPNMAAPSYPGRNPNCPNKWTPCYGLCMDSDYPFKCGDGLCLSVNDMQFYRECKGACIRNHVSCEGTCRLGYSPCDSRNQCFKNPEGRCDKRRDCADATDETGCFRTFLQWVALPTLIFLFLVILAVYFALGWFIRRSLSYYK